jgi:hypothetical protein
MFQEISELRLAQADGGLPTVAAAGSAPGESGVFVLSARFHGGGHVSATPRRHHICFHLTPSAHIDSRMAGHPRRPSIIANLSGVSRAPSRRSGRASLFQLGRFDIGTSWSEADTRWYFCAGAVCNACLCPRALNPPSDPIPTPNYPRRLTLRCDDCGRYGSCSNREAAAAEPRSAALRYHSRAFAGSARAWKLGMPSRLSPVGS